MGERIDAVVLAAGLASRAGSLNKLLLPLAGKPLAAHVIDAALASRVRHVHVVTGYEADTLTAALGDRPLKFAHNPDYRSGMGGSLAAGVRNLADDSEGAIVCLADMPLVAAHHLNQLIEHFRAGRVCAPYCQGRRGNPVLFCSTFFDDLLQLAGDTGARQLLEALADSITRVDVEDEGIFYNVNRPADLRSHNSTSTPDFTS